MSEVTFSQAQVDAIVDAALARALGKRAPVREHKVSEPVRSLDGRDFACTATPACGRMLRSKARASVHAADNASLALAGHIAR